MTCDECGCRLDPDDEIDYTGARYSVGNNGVSRSVKAMCPNCGHIQYGVYSQFHDPGELYMNEEDGD